MSRIEENGCSKFILNSELIYFSQNKYLLTDPKGNSELCFLETVNFPIIERHGVKKALLSVEPVMDCFVIPPNSKIEQIAKHLFA